MPIRVASARTEPEVTVRGGVDAANGTQFFSPQATDVVQRRSQSLPLVIEGAPLEYRAPAPLARIHARGLPVTERTGKRAARLRPPLRVRWRMMIAAGGAVRFSQRSATLGSKLAGPTSTDVDDEPVAAGVPAGAAAYTGPVDGRHDVGVCRGSSCFCHPRGGRSYCSRMRRPFRNSEIEDSSSALMPRARRAAVRTS